MHLIQSNRLEVLADALAESLRAAPAGPFEQPVIVVPSTLMERWLTLALVDRLGFIANIRFELAAACAWRLMAAVLPDVAAESPFAADALRWRLMAVLADGKQAGVPVRHYLSGHGALGQYRLAGELAEVFEAYATYRPDWLEAWADGGQTPGGDAAWQASLWRTVVQSMPAVPARHPRHAFLAKLARDPAARAALPASMSLFALDALPPVYLDIFAGVAAYCPVTLYLHNPSREYWTDVRRPQVSRATAAAESGALDLAPNEMLAANGQYGRALVEAIIEAGFPSADLWRTSESSSLLAAVQANILEFREQPPNEPHSWAEGDRSIEIHDCHSAMREAEVLHDVLLARFQDDASLLPEDVAVYVCGTGQRAAALAAVFAAAPEDRRIPFSCYPEVSGEDRPLVQSVLAVIATARGRGAAPEVLALIEEPALAGRFQLEVADAALLGELIRRASIRWGWDEWSWREHDLPPERRYTWAAGLERLLLGAVLSDECSAPIGGIAPVHGVEGSELGLLGALQELAAALSALAKELRESRSMGEWMQTVEALIDDFHEESRYPPEHARALRSTLFTIGQAAARAGFDEPVPFDVALSELHAALARGHFKRGAVAGGVRVISMAAGHVVPARIVCIVGANDGLLPGPVRTASFDLMPEHPRRGDRNARDAQRYAFLAAVLGARDALMVLYDGHSVRDNTPLLPAACVTGLREAVVRMTGLAAEAVDRRLRVVHPLQPFSPACFAIAGPHTSFAAEWLSAGHSSAAAPFVEGLSLPFEESSLLVTLDLIELFFRHPAKFFFQRRLGLFLPELDDEPCAQEPFDLDALDSYWMRDELVRALLAGRQPEEVETRVRAAGVLPAGAWGHEAFVQCAGEAREIADEVRGASDSAGETNRIDLRIGDFRLLDAGRWPGQGSHVLWRAGPIRAQDRLRGWIQHLARCACGVARGHETLFIGAETLRFAPMNADRAGEQLMHLLGWYRQGLVSVLPFFPETSLAFAAAERDAAGSGRVAAARAWAGSTFDAGNPTEGPRTRSDQDDPYFALAARGRHPLGAAFERVAHAIYDPLLECVSAA